MAVVAPVGAPTRVDAEVAASALIAAGVEEVLLFGSVARGTAGPHSDIDLVALFADLDYSQRHERRRQLEAAAGELVPWPVQVHVSDLPEWRARTTRVRSSFERRVAASAVVVAAASVRGRVMWDKEMVLPMSDPQEALNEFRTWVLKHLRGVANASRAGPEEGDPLLPLEERELARLDRMVDVCAAVAATAETALKALAVLHKTPTPRTKDLKDAGHRMPAVMKLLPDKLQPEMAAIFDRYGIDLGVLPSWREDSTYPADADAIYALADRLAPTYAALAADLAGVVLEHLQREIPNDPALPVLADRCRRHRETIVAHDICRGLRFNGGIDV